MEIHFKGNSSTGIEVSLEMKPRLACSILLFAAAGVGCSTADRRIRQNPETVARLDPATQQLIRRGEVQPGFTAEMVRLALGEPRLREQGAAYKGPGDEAWGYPHRNPNPRDYIRNGVRYRLEYDPRVGSDRLIREPVDERLFPHLRNYVLYVRFQQGRVLAVDRVESL